jgi:hypothetical protein
VLRSRLTGWSRPVRGARVGQQGRSSPGAAATRAGALLIAAALIILAIGLITNG